MSSPPRAGPRRHRRLRALLWLLPFLAGLLALEGALRIVLFAGWTDGTALARRLRQAHLYAASTGQDYWKLDVLFHGGRAAERPSPTFDERTGWLPAVVNPLTLAHGDEAQLSGRRPVLLFGDSFAQCVQRAGPCWQELLEASDLGPRFRLLNYGVGGYGLDQAALLCRLALEQLRVRDTTAAPIVVIGILVDDDLDRCFLRVRTWPKPWFTLEKDELVLHPPAARSPLELVRADPPGIRSYLWRGLLFGTGWVEHGTAERWTGAVPPLPEREALCARILSDLWADLEAREIPGFFLLFHARSTAATSGPAGWQEPFLYRFFREHRLPFVSTKRWLCEHARAAGVGLDAFYYGSGSGLNHFNELGNRVAFEALRQGLLGSFEPYEYMAER